MGVGAEAFRGNPKSEQTTDTFTLRLGLLRGYGLRLALEAPPITEKPAEPLAPPISQPEVPEGYHPYTWPSEEVVAWTKAAIDAMNEEDAAAEAAGSKPDVPTQNIAEQWLD